MNAHRKRSLRWLLRAVVPALAGVLAPAAALADPLPVATAPAPAPSDVALFAIVIGNNRPEDAETATLRYADDDAVETHKMLVEAGVRSALLARLDDDTRRLFPQVAPDGLPRGADLDRAVTRAFGEMQAEKDRGRSAELFVFYSGHGDVAHGQGYVMLEDRRLGRGDLYDLLSRSPAQRNHVFIDACKSYFLAFERGPGGQRVPFRGSLKPAGEPGKLDNVGFVLSTSSDHESHEWERFQGGIFSHELRSALRGAADSDADGRVTYAELGAFVASANRAIVNPRFRPDVLVRPPQHDLHQEVLRWRGGPDTLRVDGGKVGHFYVEDAHGERVLDAHPAAGRSMTLHLPASRPLFVRQHDGRAEAVVERDGPRVISALTPRSVEIGTRGALQLAFEQFFAASFDGRDVASYEREQLRRATTPVAPDEGRIARALLGDGDAAEARGPSPSVWRTPVLVAGAAALAGGLVLNGLALQRGSIERASQQETAADNVFIHRADVGSIVCYAVAAVAGATWAALTWRPQRRAAPVEPAP